MAVNTEREAKLDTVALVRTVVDEIPAMVAYWDKNQVCRFANRAYEKWFGVRAEAVIGRTIEELLGPLYPLNWPYIEKALGGEEQEFEREIPDPSQGPPRYSQAHYIPHVVDGMRLAADRVRETVGGMKLLARGDAVQRERVNVADCVERIIAFAANTLRYRARLSLEIAPDLYVDANDAQLSQVFAHLLANAAHALLEDTPAQNQICIAARRDGDQILIEVADNGRGIAEELQSRIFEPFFSRTSSAEGMGMGLSISRTIVERLGGAISVTSGSQGSVTAKGGRDALVALEGKSFDLILCDLMMPEMKGEEFYRQAVRRWPQLARRFVFCTGGAFTPRGRQFLAAVPAPVLQKPFPIDELLGVVRARVQATLGDMSQQSSGSARGGGRAPGTS